MIFPRPVKLAESAQLLIAHKRVGGNKSEHLESVRKLCGARKVDRYEILKTEFHDF